jgi:integrase
LLISVKTGKTGGTATIPLFPLLADLIRQFLPRRGEYVFPECALMYKTNPDGISLRVRKVLIDAGYSVTEETRPEACRGELGMKRTTGVRRACVRGFHSFRVTWVTLALVAGVPMELVRKVTSHRTVEVVLAHYFKPSREDFRRELGERMPAMFSAKPIPASETGSTSQMDAVLTDLQQMTPENWMAVRDRLVKQLKRTG